MTSPNSAGPPDSHRQNDQPARHQVLQGSGAGQISSGARQRGQLVIAEKVVEKIAGQAAAEIAAASGRSGGFFGIGSHEDSTAIPKVDVDLATDSADLALRVGIAYPQSIRQATQQVRDHVARRVQELTGVSVHRVDVDIAWLTTADSRGTGAAAGDTSTGSGGLR